ncbi:MAG: hypothetical protein NPIRA01_17670 [Nitrospirales bacterium]|nr:MAG: hypothetical protein NPIRA01_17670 [Nitrospirales bacterium]
MIIENSKETSSNGAIREEGFGEDRLILKNTNEEQSVCEVDQKSQESSSDTDNPW